MKIDTSNWRPWYDILWRLPGGLIMYVGRCIFTVGAFLAFGPDGAARAWRDTH